MRSGLEEVFCVAEDPGILHRGTTDHDAAHVCGVAALLDVFARGDISIPDHWDRNKLAALIDHFPIGKAGVALRTGAAVNGNRLHPAVFEDVANFGCVDEILLPSDSNSLRQPF